MRVRLDGESKDMTYEYRHVTVERIIDGDSIILEIDLGARISWRDSFRLEGIDCPEKGQPGHMEATTRLTELLAHGISRVQTYKPDKYGRFLIDIWVAVSGGEQLVNQKLISEGHAVEYHGGKK